MISFPEIWIQPWKFFPFKINNYENSVKNDQIFFTGICQQRAGFGVYLGKFSSAFQQVFAIHVGSLLMV